MRMSLFINSGDIVLAPFRKIPKNFATPLKIAEALAIGTPSIITREIAENIEAETKSFDKELVITEKALIRTWSDVVYLYFERLY